MIISMKKGKLSWFLKLSRMEQVSSEFGTKTWRVYQQAIEKGQ
jgi:hypothetical protein